MAGLAYLLLAHISLYLVYPFGSIATIWPPSGLALGLVLVSKPGRRGKLLLSLLAANLVANFISGNSLAISLGFAVANSFETLLCALLLNWQFSLSIPLNQIILGIFQVLTVSLGLAIAAGVGAGFAALALHANFWNAWLTWWIADGVGIMVITPFVLAWAGFSFSSKDWKSARTIERIGVSVLLLGTSAIEFLTPNTPFAFSELVFPLLAILLILAAVRFSWRYITLIFLPLSAMVIWGTVQGLGSFFEHGIEPHISILTAQIFLGIVASGLYLLNKGVKDLVQTGAYLRSEIAHGLSAEARLLSANRKLRQDMQEIVDLNDNLRFQAIRDPLTGLYNRRYLTETMDREIAKAQRGNRPLSVLMLDIDHFKKINDTFGHAAGDEVLLRLGQLLAASVREGDIVCRYGGEEFVVVMLDAGAEDAQARGETLCHSISKMHIPLGVAAIGNVELSITCSVGMAVLPAHGGSWEMAIDSADAAMYRAKRGGRNRVVSAGFD